MCQSCHLWISYGSYSLSPLLLIGLQTGAEDSNLTFVPLSDINVMLYLTNKKPPIKGVLHTVANVFNLGPPYRFFCMLLDHHRIQLDMNSNHLVDPVLHRIYLSSPQSVSTQLVD